MFTIVYFSMDQILCHAIPSCFDSSGVFIFIFIFFLNITQQFCFGDKMLLLLSAPQLTYPRIMSYFVQFLGRVFAC